MLKLLSNLTSLYRAKIDKIFPVSPWTSPWRVSWGKIYLLFFLLFSYSSCTNQGCIEANDFGEYQTQVLTINANGLGNNCTYNSSASLTDPSQQGSGIFSCLTSGTDTIDAGDGNGPQSVTSGGCAAYSTPQTPAIPNIAVVQNICIQQCVTACINNNSAGSGSAEPDWVATTPDSSGQNGFVTLTSGAQISINATGTIILGGSVSAPSIYAESNSYGLQALTSTFSQPSFNDVIAGSTKNIIFSGSWTDGAGLSVAANSATDRAIPGGTTTLSSGIGGDIALTARQQAAFELGNRLVAYITPAPAGYNFNSQLGSPTPTEYNSTTGTPLYANANLWNCTYQTSPPPAYSLTDMSCSSYSYDSTHGYPNIGPSSTTAAATLYGINSTTKASNLGTIGGSIRWSGDNLVAFNSPDGPFDAVISCGSSCTPPTMPANTSLTGIVGDLSASTPPHISNTSNVAMRLAFKGITDNSHCRINLSGTITNSNNPNINIPTGPISFNLTANDWSGTYLELEAGDTLTFNSDTTSYGGGTGITPGHPNCGQLTAYKMLPLQDIAIQQSGLVSFAMLGQSGATIPSPSSCTLSARIINPTGSRVDLPVVNSDFGTGSADFYEYDSFATSASKDPLASFIVQASDTSSYTSPGSITWSTPAFVRKGQVIRFDPSSWNQTWYPSGSGAGLSRQCGIGTVMKIIPRPAFLCRGTASSSVANPNCSVAVNSAGAQYCQFVASPGNFSPCGWDNSSPPLVVTTGGVELCPNTLCQCGSTADQTNGTGSPSGCTYTPTLCDSNPTGSITNKPIINSTTCAACANDLLTRMKAPGAPTPSTNVTLSQCYDLENYTGAVRNINPTTGLSNAELTNPTYGKGAALLSNFNGNTYGNFTNIVKNTNPTHDTYGNPIYALASSTTIGTTGRLQFLVLSGSDFLNLSGTNYSHNSNGTSYNGLNGYQISMSGPQQFQNGQWLEAILCNESGNGSSRSYVCSGMTSPQPTQDTGQPAVVLINDPTSPVPGPVANSTYQFNASGNLSGANTYYAHSDTTNENSLVLSFKIKDSEVSNCKTSSPASACNGSGCPGDSSCPGPGCDGLVIPNNFYINPTCTKVGSQCCLSIDASGNCCRSQNSNGTCNSSGSGVINCGIPSGSPLACSSPTTNPNTNTICPLGQIPGDAPANCHTQYVCANKYYNNSGSYSVTVQVQNQQSNISSLVGSVITPIMNVMNGNPNASPPTIGMAQTVYQLVIGNASFQLIIQLLLILMITFYGVGYLMGVSEFSQGEIIGRVIKIGVIYLFIFFDPHNPSMSGWYFFNETFVSLFQQGTSYVTYVMAGSFDNSSEIKTAIANNDFSDPSVLFSSVDQVFSMFLSSSVQHKVEALLFASIFGWAYLFIIYLSFFLYIYAVATAVLLYLTAQVFISILFVLGPLFFLSLLFNATKEMFDKWLGQLIGFSLQQIFLLTTLAFFNMMMYEVIKASLGYRVCWDDVWVINIYITQISLLSFWTIASMPPRLDTASAVGNIGNPAGIPSLFSILFIWIIASLMNKFITFMTDAAASIGGSLKATSMADGAIQAAKAVRAKAGDIYQNGFDGKGGIGSKIDEGFQKADRALFDSGKLADKDRADKQAQGKQDISDRAALKKANSKAISDFKKNNAVELSKMEPQKQEEALRDAGMKGMHALAKERGISEARRDQLISGKASLGGSTTVTGLALELFQKRGSLTTTVAGKKIDTGLSSSELKSAMKKKRTDDAGRATISSAVKDGRLEARSSIMTETKNLITDGAKAYGAQFKKGNIGRKIAVAVTSPITAPIAAATGLVVAVGGAGAAAAGSVGTGISRKLGGAGRMISGLGTTVADSVIGGKDRNQASRELEAKGAISKRRTFRIGIPFTKLGIKVGKGEWSRSDAEKQAINERAREIRAKREDKARPATVQNSSWATGLAARLAGGSGAPASGVTNDVGQSPIPGAPSGEAGTPTPPTASGGPVIDPGAGIGAPIPPPATGEGGTPTPPPASGGPVIELGAGIGAPPGGWLQSPPPATGGSGTPTPPPAPIGPQTEDIEESGV